MNHLISLQQLNPERPEVNEESTPPRIREIVKSLVKWHGDTIFEALQLSGGKKRQASHRDSPSMRAHKLTQLKLEKKVFSCLLAVQEGTAWMDGKRNRIEIEPGTLLIWRGDYRHSGARDLRLNKKINHRIFFNISNSIHTELDFDQVGDLIN